MGFLRNTWVSVGFGNISYEDLVQCGVQGDLEDFNLDNRYLGNRLREVSSLFPPSNCQQDEEKAAARGDSHA